MLITHVEVIPVEFDLRIPYRLLSGADGGDAKWLGFAEIRFAQADALAHDLKRSADMRAMRLSSTATTLVERGWPSIAANSPICQSVPGPAVSLTPNPVNPTGSTISYIPYYLGLSPDGTRLFVSETYSGRILRFDVTGSGRLSGNRPQKRPWMVAAALPDNCW